MNLKKLRRKLAPDKNKLRTLLFNAMSSKTKYNLLENILTPVQNNMSV